MKCNQANCENESAYKFTWPGKDESQICADCVPKLKAVANSIGLHLQIRPLTVADIVGEKGE